MIIKEGKSYQNTLGELAAIYRAPQRPLERVSNFVVEQLPQQLLAVKTDRLTPAHLTERIGSVVRGHRPHSLSQSEARLAFLDACLLERCGVIAGGETVPSLVALVAQLAEQTNQPAGLTYQAIIVDNPKFDARVTTTDATGLEEHAFYETHRQAEAVMHHAIQHLFAVVRGEASQQNTAYVLAAARDMEQIAYLKRQLGEGMSPQRFAEFRPYLGVHPVTQMNGPSGAYTAGEPIIEILLGGDQFPPQYFEYLDKNRQYFPAVDLPLLDAAITLTTQGPGLATMAGRSGNADLITATGALKQAILLGKGSHRSAIANQIPGVLRGEGPGTGGVSDVAQFLQRKIQMINDIHIGG